MKRLTTIVCSFVLFHAASCVAQDPPSDAADTTFNYVPSIESLRLDATFSLLFSFGVNLDVNILQMRRSEASACVLGLRAGVEGTRWSMHEQGPFARDLHVLLRAGTFVQRTRWDVFAGIAHRTTFGTVATNNIRRLQEREGLILKAGVETSRILLHPVFGVHARVSLVYGKRATDSFLDYVASIGIGVNLGWQRDHSSISP